MMKYVLIGGVLAVFIAGGIYYIGGNGHMNMGAMRTIEDSLTVLPEHAVSTVKPTEVITLQDGDTFDLEATIVTQEVGNRTVKRLAYNGQIPGPILKVQKDAKVTVNFTNNIDMETSLHSHGLRGDWEFDGAVPITPAVQIGETFSYELEFPDTGVYWYHPHVREDYQQELGLYGNFIVEEEDYWNTVDQEAYLIFDDILEDGDFDRESVDHTLMGRFGNRLLINDSDTYTLNVKAGEITRVFMTNVANTRTFDVHFEGSLMKLVGGDIGRIEKETAVEEVHFAPAERYIVEILYTEPGTYAIQHRGEIMGTVVVEAGDMNRIADFGEMRVNTDDYAEIQSEMETLLAQKPDKRLRLDIEMNGMMGGMKMDRTDSSMSGMGRKEYGGGGMMMDGDEKHSEDGIEWEDDMAMMNQMSTDESIEWVIEDQDTGKKNGDIDWSFAQGDMVKVRIYNDETGMHPMQHPIHFHGQRFVVLTRDGEVNTNLQWKDTVLIPRGQTIDILVDMSNPGKWMAHCHIAEHLHSGMMFNFDVKE